MCIYTAVLREKSKFRQILYLQKLMMKNYLYVHNKSILNCICFFNLYQNYLNTVKSFHSVLCQSEIFLTASSLRIVPMNLSTSCSLIRSFQFSTHGKRNLAWNIFQTYFTKHASDCDLQNKYSLIKSIWFRFSLLFCYCMTNNEGAGARASKVHKLVHLREISWGVVGWKENQPFGKRK